MIESELFQLVSDEDESVLAGELEVMGEIGWFEWLATNEVEVIAFLEATPSRRSKLKKWQVQPTRLLLTLGAYQLSGLAGEVLYASSYLGSGGSWRDNASGAGSVAFQIVKMGVFRWPFAADAPSGWREI